MKTIHWFIVCACLLSMTLHAQKADTYQIEKLSKPNNLLQTVLPDKLYENIEGKEFVKLSVTDPLVVKGMHPVIGGYLQAYQEHRPITLSPDIAWLLICQGFSQHVNNNVEELRNKFVNFEGKQTIVVKRFVSEETDLHTFPWESVFPEFVEKVGGYVGEELTRTLTADFTTTTPNSLIASQITILDAMKGYMSYKVIMVGCGIPAVTIEGSVKDWQKILEKLNTLAKYDLEWWVKELQPVIKEIIKTKSGQFNKDFWMQMIRFHKQGLYGAHEDIDGWFLKFYPYLSDKSRSKMTSIKSLNVLPKEIVSVPFVFEAESVDGVASKTLDMEFWAGFMGLQQNDLTYNLKPEIGWAINIVTEKKDTTSISTF